MARAIKRVQKQAQSPQEVLAKDAEYLAKRRLGYDIDGIEYVTEFEGQLIVNVAKMYEELLTK